MHLGLASSLIWKWLHSFYNIASGGLALVVNNEEKNNNEDEEGCLDLIRKTTPARSLLTKIKLDVGRDEWQDVSYGAKLCSAPW